MKDKIIKVIVNAVIGALTSILSIYVGANAIEAVALATTATATVGSPASDFVSGLASEA